MASAVIPSRLVGACLHWGPSVPVCACTTGLSASFRFLLFCRGLVCSLFLCCNILFHPFSDILCTIFMFIPLPIVRPFSEGTASSFSPMCRVHPLSVFCCIVLLHRLFVAPRMSLPSSVLCCVAVHTPRGVLVSILDELYFGRPQCLPTPFPIYLLRPATPRTEFS